MNINTLIFLKLKPKYDSYFIQIYNRKSNKLFNDCRKCFIIFFNEEKNMRIALSSSNLYSQLVDYII